jgi:hypothetical protein
MNEAELLAERKRVLALARKGPFSELAAQSLKKYLEERPEDALAHYKLAGVLIRLDYVNNREDHSEALKHFETWRKLREEQKQE